MARNSAVISRSPISDPEPAPEPVLNQAGDHVEEPGGAGGNISSSHDAPETDEESTPAEERLDDIDEDEHLAGLDVWLPLPESTDLDDDEDTSLVFCLQFHLISEHGLAGALTIDDENAEALHVRLHAAMDLDHSVVDRRFRPGRAIAILMENCQREHDLTSGAGQPVKDGSAIPMTIPVQTAHT